MEGVRGGGGGEVLDADEHPRHHLPIVAVVVGVAAAAAAAAAAVVVAAAAGVETSLCVWSHACIHVIHMYYILTNICGNGGIMVLARWRTDSALGLSVTSPTRGDARSNSPRCDRDSISAGDALVRR
jgi:hypothetical protein